MDLDTNKINIWILIQVKKNLGVLTQINEHMDFNIHKIINVLISVQIK